MTQPKPNQRESLQWLLLDMIGSARKPSAARLAELSASECETLSQMAAQHRLEPLLHKRATEAGSAWLVPSDLRIVWRAAYGASALRSLALKNLLLRIHGILGASGIGYAALKGAFLAWYGWPHPALRPLRDIDILVPRAQALDAYERLLANGFHSLPGAAPPEAVIDCHKHLPPLFDPKSGGYVEIHTQLIHPDASKHTTARGRFSTKALARRSQCAANSPINYLDPTDALLHLVVHAAVDHSFDNGPLLFGDLACMIRHHPPEWSVFWARAEEIGATRACQIAFAMTERSEGPLHIDWPGGMVALVPETIIERASLMTLADFERRAVAGFAARWLSRGWRKRLSLVGSHAFPSRHVLHALTPARRKPLALPFAYLWWAANKAQTRLIEANSPTASGDARSAALVLQWLEGEH